MGTSEAYADRTGLEIAIVGMAGRFPSARNLTEFWQNLRDGKETITFFSDDELLAEGASHARLAQSNYVKARAVLDDVELFDAAFFGITPREAEIIDPQQRIFLECAWETLENANCDPETYPGAIGLFAGVSADTYFLFNLYANSKVQDSVGQFQLLIGNHKDSLTTRVSYKLDLKGPSVVVQTACSTSLVAVHLACQSLLSGDCDMALAGGVSIAVPQICGYLYEEGGILSPDGHCRPFDERARGTICGNGVGIVALKKLDDALADGDFIHAVIKGTAINNDGRLKAGYTAPSENAQAKVIATAHGIAEVEPETITYVEAHGTATELGDPIEIAALTRAFRTRTEKKGFCGIGSVKSNLGHLDSAAGVAGLIKTVLALKHKMIPPSLHFERPNPKIDFANSPFYVVNKLTEWKAGTTSRRAGVSSFGIGGTNAHVIVEEAPVVETSTQTRPAQLLLLAAQKHTALEAMTANLAAHLEQHPEINLADVAYSLKAGRKAFAYRRALVCRDLDGAIAALREPSPQIVQTGVHQGASRGVAFMFTGQGAQYVNMGADLYRHEPAFRKHVDHCSDLLVQHLGFDLRAVLYPDEENTPEAEAQITQTAITQPALFVIEYALAQLWMEWGIRPAAMIGHSIGEYVAACLAGVFSLEDSLRLVAARGRLMQSLPEGSMLAVPLAEKDVQPLLGEHLSLAAVNAPSLCVVSGPVDAVSLLETQLAARGLACQPVRTSHAFHSAMMEPILDAFTREVEKTKRRPPQIPYISNVTGKPIRVDEAVEPSYYARHLRQTVRFAGGVGELLKRHDWALLEVGPGRTLCGLLERHPDKVAEQAVLPSLRHPRETKSDTEFILETLGSLWLAGVPVDWRGFYAHEKRQHLQLPSYPFERKRFWILPDSKMTSSPATKDLINEPGEHSQPLSLADIEIGASSSTAIHDATSFVPAIGTNGAQRNSEDGAELEWLMAQQLQILSNQLELLKFEE